jgi:hypothetical protein
VAGRMDDDIRATRMRLRSRDRHHYYIGLHAVRDLGNRWDSSASRSCLAYRPTRTKAPQ